MMKKLLILFMAFLALQITAQETLLRYNSSVGDAFDVKMKMTQEVGTIMAQTTEFEMTLNIIAVSDTTVVHEAKFDRMIMDMIQGQNMVNFDSSKSDDELDDTAKMMKAQIAPILKTVIKTTQSKRGEVLNVVVEPNLPQATQLSSQNSFIAFPKEPVKVGSTWSDTKQENGMNITSNYTIDAISNDTVTISMKGSVSGMGTGEMSGNITIDAKSGMPINSSMKMDMEVQGMATKIGVDVAYTKK